MLSSDRMMFQFSLIAAKTCSYTLDGNERNMKRRDAHFPENPPLSLAAEGFEDCTTR